MATLAPRLPAILIALVLLALPLRSAPARSTDAQQMRLLEGVRIDVLPSKGSRVTLTDDRPLPLLQGQVFLEITVPARSLHPAWDGPALAAGLAAMNQGLRVLLDGSPVSGMPALPERVDQDAVVFLVGADLGASERPAVLEVRLHWKEGWLPHRDTLLRANLRPTVEPVLVNRVTRYPNLYWRDCPRPCTRRPPALTREEWSRMVEVWEDGELQNPERIRLVAEVSEERPFSAVTAVDISSSTYQTRSADSARAILDYLAAFPDAAYGGDEVRDIDRLAILYFDDTFRGYYRPYGHGGGSPGTVLQAVSPKAHFFSPNDLALTWDDYCRSRDTGRFDDGWLLGLALSIEGMGLSGGFAAVPPAERMCEYLETPEMILDPEKLERCRGAGGLDPCLANRLLDQLRAVFRKSADEARLHGSLPSRTTDVIDALDEASGALHLLRFDETAPRRLRDSQQAVILISDGLDHGFLRAVALGHDATVRARLQQLEEILGERRFFFVDINSETTLGETVVRSLSRRLPLMKIFLLGIDRYVSDPALANRLVRGFYLDDSRAQLADLAEPGALDAVGSSALRAAVIEYLSGSESLHDVFVKILEATLPADTVKSILGGSVPTLTDPGAWRSSPDPWILQAAELAARWHDRLDLSPSRREFDRLHRRLEETAGAFHRLAAEQSGTAVSVHECEMSTAEGETVTGAPCAFRTIRDVMRGGIRVTYAPLPGSGRGRPSVLVEVRLSEEGSRRLAEMGYLDAGLAYATSRRAPIPGGR